MNNERNYYLIKTCIICANICSKYLKIDGDWKSNKINIFERNKSFKDAADKCENYKRARESK